MRNPWPTLLRDKLVTIELNLEEFGSTTERFNCWVFPLGVTSCAEFEFLADVNVVNIVLFVKKKDRKSVV